MFSHTDVSLRLKPKEQRGSFRARLQGQGTRQSSHIWELQCPIPAASRVSVPLPAHKHGHAAARAGTTMFSEQTEKQSAAHGEHCLQSQNNFPSSPLRAPGLCFSLIPGSRVGGCSQQRIHPAIPWPVLDVWDKSVCVEPYLSGNPLWIGVVKTPPASRK